jgi:hypothetical protein
MNLIDRFLQLFFKEPTMTASPIAATPKTAPRAPVVPITPDITLQVSKALRQLYRADEAYGLGLWPSEKEKAEWQHDLSLMLAHGDLKAVKLRVLAKDGSVPFAFDLAFTGHTSKVGPDSAQGVELPMLPPSLIAGGEALVSRCGKAEAYQNFLKGNWSKATPRTVRAGADIASEHASRITGGRLAGQLHVADEARQRLVVTQVGERGYAFGRAGELTGIFLHGKHAPKDLAFHLGDRLSAVVIQTPRGLQARDIRPAT